MSNRAPSIDCFRWVRPFGLIVLLVGGPAAATVPDELAKPVVETGSDREAVAKKEGGFSLSGAKKREPIQIDAKMLEFDARSNVAVFKGDVVTEQGEVVMHSAVLTVTFAASEDGGGKFDRAETVVAEGDVRIVRGNRVARGQRAEFDDAGRTVVLSGGAVLQEGANEVRGERVIVYLDEDRSIVEGTNSRVKAILIPGGDPEPPPPEAPLPDERAPEELQSGIARDPQQQYVRALE